MRKVFVFYCRKMSDAVWKQKTPWQHTAERKNHGCTSRSKVVNKDDISSLRQTETASLSFQCWRHLQAQKNICLNSQWCTMVPSIFLETDWRWSRWSFHGEKVAGHQNKLVQVLPHWPRPKNPQPLLFAKLPHYSFDLHLWVRQFQPPTAAQTCWHQARWSSIPGTSWAASLQTLQLNTPLL